MKDIVHCFIFADALGWELVTRHQFMEDLLPYRSRCDTLFGYSSTCDPTILTGVLPEQHGHFSFFVKAAQTSPFTSLKKWSFLPQKLAGHHRIRNKVSRYMAQKLGYTGYFQLYSVPFKYLPFLEYTETKDIYEPGGIIGGQNSIFSTWNASKKSWIRSNWRNGDSVNLDQAISALNEGEVELVYLFTAGLDATMHRYGPHSEEAALAIDQFGKNLRELNDVAQKNYKEVHLHVFSDHGMAEVTNACDMMLRWEEETTLRYGQDYVAVWDSTMARFWFLNQSARDTTIAWLKKQAEGRIVPDEELQQHGCYFSDHRYGELFYLLPTGHLFVPSFMNMGFVKGMHGYDPSDSDSAACWLTSHPTRTVKGLNDIYPVMRDAALGHER